MHVFFLEIFMTKNIENVVHHYLVTLIKHPLIKSSATYFLETEEISLHL